MAFVPITNLSATAASSTRINLAWSNGQAYSYNYVYRKASGGSYSNIAILSGSATSYSDTTCQDGTKYYYYVHSEYGLEDGGDSNEVNATTSLLAPSGLSGTATTTTVVLTWNDNCQNESGFKVYKRVGSGAYSLLATLGANVETYTATGLTAGTWYSFYITAYNAIVTSAVSNTETILTADPPAKPDTLVATATATTKVRLTWQDNADNESDYRVEKSSTSASAGFSEVVTLGANVESYEVTGLTSNTQYWFRVRAHNDSGYSAYCTVATAVTFAAIAAPTNLVVTAISGTVVDIYFQDNSELEDFHILERYLATDPWSGQVDVSLAPNCNAYRVTGLSANTVYAFRVRAKQGASSYSGYSDAVTITTPSVPAAPTGLAVSEYQDTWLRLSWALSATATGYKIQRSATDAWAGEEVTVATIPDDISSFKVTGLTASTLYYFRLIAYNGVGDAAATASVSQTTRAAYSRSKFERLIRRSSPYLVYLIEVNPLIKLQGWALTTAQTYTYETAFDERGAAIDGVYENGVALTQLTSIATVEAAAGSWWHDTATAMVYVHPTGGDDPNNYTVTGSFWVRFTTGATIDYAGNCYLPTVADGGIPDISQEISRYFDGNFIITSGQISLINGKIGGQHHFDRLFGKYLFLNRKVKILAGGGDFTYSEFETVNTGIVNSYSCNDQRMTFDLRDYRDGIHKTLPADRFTADEFAMLDENAADMIKQYWYGAATNVIPVCIDTTNRIFQFHDGRIKSVEYVYQNGNVLTANTDYFVDYQRGRIILARGLTFSADDIILVDFTGAVTAADEVIQTGAGIFKHLMNNYLNVPDSDLDLDSIWATHVSLSTALVLGLWKETDSQELIRRIERSIQADTFQDAEGRLGIKARLTSAPSDVTYIPNAYVMSGFEMARDKESIYSAVNVWYAEDPSTDKYALHQASSPSMTYLHGVSKPLDVYTALATSTAAATLASAIIALLDKTPISLTVPRSLFKHLPGDVFYLTRDRYYNQSGTASDKLMRIISIGKGASSGRTGLTVEEV